jgi:hypothetical protein
MGRLEIGRGDDCRIVARRAAWIDGYLVSQVLLPPCFPENIKGSVVSN